MKIICDRCAQELIEPGALVYSPPIDGFCRKLYLCATCYVKVWKVIKKEE